MEFETWSHRNGLELFKTSAKYSALWGEVESGITQITDRDLLFEFEGSSPGTQPTSISHVITKLLSEKFAALSWEIDAKIFSEVDYRGKSWSLDFSKGDMAVEIGFDHASVIAWNLIKPTLASEPNDVKQELSASAAVIISATKNLKTLGGFDGAIGTFERYVQYLRPLQQLLPTPLVIIGLEPPKSFHIEHTKVGNRNIGKVVMNS